MSKAEFEQGNVEDGMDFRRLRKVEFVGSRSNSLCYLKWSVISSEEFLVAK